MNFFYNKTAENNKNYIFIDAHVLNTPVIADLDGDNNDEIIVPVSYYFDRYKWNFSIYLYYSNEYFNLEKINNLDINIDINKYVASGIAVFNLKTLELEFLTNIFFLKKNFCFL